MTEPADVKRTTASSQYADDSDSFWLTASELTLSSSSPLSSVGSGNADSPSSSAASSTGSCASLRSRGPLTRSSSRRLRSCSSSSVTSLHEYRPLAEGVVGACKRGRKKGRRNRTREERLAEIGSRRETKNARERRRVNNLNTGYSLLQGALGVENREHSRSRSSKLLTLTTAIDYIKDLMAKLDNLQMEAGEMAPAAADGAAELRAGEIPDTSLDIENVVGANGAKRAGKTERVLHLESIPKEFPDPTLANPSHTAAAASGEYCRSLQSEGLCHNPGAMNLDCEESLGSFDLCEEVSGNPYDSLSHSTPPRYLPPPALQPFVSPPLSAIPTPVPFPTTPGRVHPSVFTSSPAHLQFPQLYLPHFSGHVVSSPLSISDIPPSSVLLTPSPSVTYPFPPSFEEPQFLETYSSEPQQWAVPLGPPTLSHFPNLQS